jgi:hypothetical protein
METLISPEYNFELFCFRVSATDPKDPIAVIDIASTEAWLARKLHRQTTQDDDFRRGSRGRAYCDDLRRLVFVLMNGEFPADTSDKFKIALRPLAINVLHSYEIGSLRQHFR